MDRILKNLSADRLAARAIDALLSEAHFTPKPGMVDESNNGAHSDMDLVMFERSAAALSPYFEKFVITGGQYPDCFPPLQAVGIEAERAMLEATGGVNTHRGAIYAFGLLLGAIGASMRDGRDVFERAAALADSRQISQNAEDEPASHGEIVMLRHGAGGARKEAGLGFPTARDAAKVLRERGKLDALLFILSRCEDTNLLYRGGQSGLNFVRRSSRLILKMPSCSRELLTRILDRAMIRRSLSPGGCADIFALAIFIEGIGEKIGYNVIGRRAAYGEIC